VERSADAAAELFGKFADCVLGGEITIDQLAEAFRASTNKQIVLARSANWIAQTAITNAMVHAGIEE
jgi:hypothetical protein